MRILIDGKDLDINDDEALALVCDERGRATVANIPTNYHSKALRTIISNLHLWVTKNGALLAQAKHVGAGGIGFSSALDAHNYIASLIGEPDLNVAEVVQVEEEHVPEPAALEGDEVPGPKHADEL